MIVNKLSHSVWANSQHWLTYTCLAIAVLLTSINSSLAEKPTQPNIPEGLANGVSLYGESDRPNVVGKEYIVFEKIGAKVIGAFYLPRSEFSCFYGNFRGSKLALTLIDTYDGQKYNYSLALNSRGLTASKLPMMGTPTYQPLGKISDSDRRILDACKLQLQNRSL
jgi:hypothetical protein